jgi:hypothetical protein
MRNMLPLAAAIVLGLTANAFAQADPHHPQGAPAPEAEMPAETQATPQAPPMNCRDMMSGMMGNMTPQDGSPQMQTMRMMHMMQMMQMMQAMHMQMMQQMQQDLMSPSEMPNKGVSP